MRGETRYCVWGLWGGCDYLEYSGTGLAQAVVVYRRLKQRKDGSTIMVTVRSETSANITADFAAIDGDAIGTDGRVVAEKEARP